MSKELIITMSIERNLLSFHAFTKTNENLEYEEAAAPASTSGTASALPSDALSESEETATDALDFGEGTDAPTTDAPAVAEPTIAAEPNESLISKLNQMIGILNSYRNYLKTDDTNENITNKVNTLFTEFNKI